MHSVVLQIDKDIEGLLSRIAKQHNVDIGNSKEVTLRMHMTSSPNVTVWYIDGKPVLKMRRELVTENVLAYTLEVVQPLIQVPNLVTV